MERAEKLLYQSAVTEWGEKEVERLLKQDRPDEYSRKWERFQEWLCAEEEDIIIECGGIYYEDMFEDVVCPYCNGELIIEGKNGLKKCLECGNEF